MTAPDLVAPSIAPARLRATLRRGGAALVVAGVLMTVGAVVLAQLPSATFGAIWLALAFPLGGVVLLLASALLAVGLRGEDGLVGRSRIRRAALILSGAGPLALTVGFPLAFSAPVLVQWALVAVQLLVLVCTASVAATVVRSGAVVGAARWSFAVLAVIDAAALVLLAVPTMYVGWAVLLAGVRPVAVAVVGVLLVLDARTVAPGR